MFLLIDFGLMLVGCSIVLVNRSKWFQWINILFGLFATLYYIYLAFVVICRPNTTFWGSLENWSFIIGNTMTRLLFISKRTKLRLLLKQIKSMADISTSRFLKRLEMLMVFLYLMSLTIAINYTLVTVSDPIALKSTSEWFWFWLDRITFRHQMAFATLMWYKAMVRDQWMKVTILVYVYIAIALEKLANQQISRWLPIKTLKNMQTCLITKHQNLSMKEQFVDIVKLLPLNWLVWIFLGTSSVIVESSGLQLWYMIDIIEHLVIVFGAIFFINYHRDQNRSLCQLVIRNFVNQSSLDKYSNIEYIKSELMSDVEYTAFGLFNLNNGLLLSFMSGLITFTVMFIQLHI